MEFNFRKSVKKDVYKVYNLVCQLKDSPLNKSVFIKKFNKNIEEPSIEYWVLEWEDSLLVGFLSIYGNDLLHHNDIIYEIHEFVVDAKFRGQGLGTIMMNFILAKLDSKNIELSSNKSRNDARRFYEKCGFQNTHNKFVKE